METIDYESMTDEQLSELAAIAVGYSIQKNKHGDYGIFDPDGELLQSCSPHTIDTFKWHYIPAFAESIADAHTLAHEFDSDNWLMYTTTNRHMHAIVRIANISTEETVVKVEHDQLARAICVAWLKWRDMRRDFTL